MKNLKIEYNGETLWSFKGLVAFLNVSKDKVSRWIAKGAIERVALPCGLWFRISDKWKVEHRQYCELVRKESDKWEPIKVVWRDPFLWYSWEELRLMEGIDDDVMHNRCHVGLYKREGDKYRFLTDKEWNERKRVKEGVTHGNDVALKKEKSAVNFVK